ncbi:MAG: acetyl-CoA carboxylase biotin carboxyl carrier protein [Zhaonellaceae bacterium]|nr:acetyl-CoA carboxylase biotin carboxyl carrier protein [Clostridia bacterium]
MQPIKVTDTTLRDAHQSLWATRMHTEDMIPIAKQLDNIGYHSLEVWGGATFDVCLRYLGENPWNRLRTLKKHIKKTPLQMLLRGQSLVGYQHYPDDVVDAFITRAVANGIDIIRIFDALNDLRNMEFPIKVAKREGAHVQGSVVYTISPVHTVDHYLETAIELENMGVDSICIKDMAGLLAPFKAYELVKLFKENLHVPIQLHSHYIGGLAVGAYLMAAQAGVDIIDTASIPLAFGSSQPPVETIVRALADTPYDSGLKMNELFNLAKYFEELRKRLGYERGVTRITDMWVFQHQVPGGMITNLVNQLREQKAAHRLEEVLREIPRVRKDLGYPPLVTPTSQIVGTQAVLNVLTGERYKLVPGEVKAYVKGLYGKPPGPVNKEIQKLIIGDEEPIKERPADLLEPKMDSVKEEIAHLTNDIDDIISYALFPQVAKKFFENRQKGIVVRESDIDEKKAVKKAREEDIKNIGNEKGAFDMEVRDIKELIKSVDSSNISELKIEVDGLKLQIKRGGTEQNLAKEIRNPSNNETSIKEEVPIKKVEVAEEKGYVVKSPMVGTFYAAPSPDAQPFVQVGDMVEKGQTLCIIEAMKLMNEIEAEVSGKVVKVLVDNAEPVEYGQDLFVIAEV